MNWKFDHSAERFLDAVGLGDLTEAELLQEAVSVRHGVRGCVVVAATAVIIVDGLVKSNPLCALAGIVFSKAIKTIKLSELAELFAQELYEDKGRFKLVQRVLRKTLMEEESDE